MWLSGTKIKEARRRKRYKRGRIVYMCNKMAASQHAPWVVFEVEVYVPAGWHDGLLFLRETCRRFLLSSGAVVRHLGNTSAWCCDMFWMWRGLNGCGRIMQWAGARRVLEGLTYGVHKVRKITEVEQGEQQLWFTAGRKVWENYTLRNTQVRKPRKQSCHDLSVQSRSLVRTWVSREDMCSPNSSQWELFITYKPPWWFHRLLFPRWKKITHAKKATSDLQ